MPGLIMMTLVHWCITYIKRPNFYQPRILTYVFMSLEQPTVTTALKEDLRSYLELFLTTMKLLLSLSCTGNSWHFDM